MGLALHTHIGHGHSHSYTAAGNAKKSKESNINVRAAFIHVLGDFLQSVGILVASLVIYFRKDWNFIDPICTFIFSILVLLTTFAIIKDVLLVLMEGKLLSHF
jgi:cation diffusion facilitator family transporter